MKPADEERELTRLLAEEPGLPASSVAALRGRVPDASELASLASRLALQGLDVTTVATPASPKAWKKWAWGGAGGVSAVLLWLGLRPEAPALPEGRESSSKAAATGAAMAPDSAPSPGQAPTVNGPTRRGAPLHAASKGEAPALTVPRASVEPSTALPPAEAPNAERHGLGPVRPQANAVALSPRAASTGTPSSIGTPSSTTSSAPALAPGTAVAPSEIELLRDARQALRQSPARALDLTDQHARVYPRGKLTQERELIAISALVALGRRTAALSRGASFERAFPTSPYRKQVGELLQ